MSFASIATCTNDEVLGNRVRAAYAKEGVDQADVTWYTMRWAIAADPSVEAPYASALAANNPNPGGDESVITDGALTAAVQAHPFVPLPGGLIPT
jgi:hypothetical protein